MDIGEGVDTALDVAKLIKEGMGLRKKALSKLRSSRERVGAEGDVKIELRTAEEIGLILPLAEDFVRCVEGGFDQANRIEAMLSMAPPVHPKFDILKANEGQMKTHLRNYISNYDFGALRGDRFTHLDFLARGLGMHLAAAQTKSIFRLTEEESIDSRSQMGTLIYKIERTIKDMKAEGYKPSVIVTPWEFVLSRMKELDLVKGFTWMEPDKSCFAGYKGEVYGLPVIREEDIDRNSIYVMDLEGFCKIRYSPDNLLECKWFTSPEWDPDRLGFYAQMNYEVTVKDPKASHRIADPRPEKE